MYVLHGTWIPHPTDAFVQTGAFYLWVETGTSRQTPPGYAVHYLSAKELDTLLVQTLRLADPYRKTVSQRIRPCHVLLPSVAGKPLPSPELARRLAVPLPEDREMALVSQAVNGYPLGNVLKDLSDLHFLAVYQHDDLELGQDLLFWVHFSQSLQQVLRKDQYIPALQYRLRPPPSAKTKTKANPTTTTFEIYPAWEIVSEEHETRLQQALQRMPAACTAARETPDAPPSCYENAGLLRHFSECVLTQLIARARPPDAFNRKISGSLLHDCIHGGGGQSYGTSAAALARYQHWQHWHQTLMTHHGDGFQLCFQLLAGGDEQAPWGLQFLAAARHDPSLRLALDDYWQLEAKAKAALRKSFGQGFEQQLLLDLGHAARMYPKLWEGLDTDQPAGLTLPLADAFTFLKEYAWVLEDAGFKVIVPAWWTPEGRQRARLRLRASGRQAQRTAAAGPGYFSLDALVKYRYELAIGEQTVTAEEWQQLVNAKTPLVQFRGQWIELDRDKMQQMLAFWQTHGSEDAAMPLSELLHRVAADEEVLDVSRDRVLADLLAKLQDPLGFQPISDPPGINGTLREYQKRGVAWLQYLEGVGLNGCLADDMGLGKTLQVITRLVTQPRNGHGPTLLIAPTSVLSNWQKEIERFAPQLHTQVHHGTQREQDNQRFQHLCQAQDMVITSFTLARKDARLLQRIAWHRVVVDEAQNIKNPNTAQTKAILKLQARHRLALTGTPVENRLLDLWSIFHFLNPGYLAKQAQFRRQFELPIQRHNDVAQAALLKRLVQPFILRRVKTDKAIIQDLPDKLEHKQYCNLTPEQASLYEAVTQEVAREIDAAEGMQRRGLILATLLRLKQICNHPRQFLQDGSEFSVARSHKLKRLSEMLEEVLAEGESLLIFTQFTDIGAALSKYLSQTLNCRTFYLHGGTSRPRREQMISAFQDPEGPPSAFVLSLKAGGVGINLTHANHVFHFDRWWNPAVEDQATDRAFRIGQTRTVFVHKFVTLGTLEERIDQMIEDKKKVASAIVGADESWLTELDNESFKRLIALNRSAVMD